MKTRVNYYREALSVDLNLGMSEIAKNRASGYRTLDAFTDMIYLTVGDVNIPEQIPARFRTL